ncbi:eukaryotic translation initiation factor 5B-like [Telopea speciosissima]|uniref:eukaryotic translation initiation factor 5B-like n=1 Tax=Telopea speciosissima TaxID=54955 RepID=UPI001CC7447F|nr:eukaryotic translation initiation factor 5B-like [Telopea speciosissima]
MEEKKKFPSLPSNYVTLQQLQERRLKEQEQRQKEKEDEEKEQRRKLVEERRLKEEQEMEREKEKERKLHEIQRAQAIEAKASGRSNRRNPRNLSEMKRWIEKEIGSEMQKGGGGGFAIGIAADGRISDEGHQPKESKQKQKGKKKTMTLKTEAKSESGVLVQSQAKNGQEGNQIRVEPKEENKRVRKKNKKMEPKMKEEEAPIGIVEEKELENGDEERITVKCDKKPVRMQRIRVGIRQGSKGTADEKAARASGVKESVNLTVKVVEITGELGDLAVANHHGQEEEEEGR